MEKSERRQRQTAMTMDNVDFYFTFIFCVSMQNEWIKIKYGQVATVQAFNKHKCHVLHNNNNSNSNGIYFSMHVQADTQ